MIYTSNKHQSVLLLLLAVSPLLAQVPPFQHVVMVIQENRTPDNLFGSNPRFEPGVDIGRTSISKTGVVVTATPRPLADCYDISHSHQSWKREFDKGKMDGFVTGPFVRSVACPTTPPHPAVVYIDNSTGTVKPYFDIAKSYGWANRMFQTNQGPSFEAHQFLLSGTSSPTELSNLFAQNNPTGGQGGCAAIATTLVQMIDPAGKMTSMYPCFERPSLTDQLDTLNLTWKYYAVGVTSIWSAPNAIQHICEPVVAGKCTGAGWANVVNKPAQVLTDIQTCKLANVTWVTPTGGNSDHSRNGTVAGGPSWVASIVNAIGNSSCGYWQNTAILITWDDWGGWFDHVPPPSLGQPNGWGTSYVYGFRVPLLVVSAYTPAGYVDNDVHDFGSILKFVEHNFGLGLIGPGFYADAYADDLSDFFTQTTPRTFATIAAPIKAKAFIESKAPQTVPDDDDDEEH